MGPKEAAEYYGKLKKRGQAAFKIILTAAPEQNFRGDQPVANVTIVSIDPTTGKILQQSSQMSAQACEYDVNIQVLTAVNVLKGLWYRLKGKGMLPPYDVTIKVEPLPEWQEGYLSKEFSVKAALGDSPMIVHVWMPLNPGPPPGIWKNSPDDPTISRGQSG